MGSFAVISDLAKADSTCEYLLQASSIGLDCQGVELGRSGGQITLVQIVDHDLNVSLFDVLTCPAILSGKLKTILESPDVIKIMHDCRHDRVNLEEQFGVRLQPVFDTQIAHKVLYQANLRIGFNKLCLKFHLQQNSLKDTISRMYTANHELRKLRPLTQQLIQYASDDVGNLIQLYKYMNPMILSSDRAEFSRMCNDATVEHAHGGFQQRF